MVAIGNLATVTVEPCVYCSQTMKSNDFSDPRLFMKHHHQVKCWICPLPNTCKTTDFPVNLSCSCLRLINYKLIGLDKKKKCVNQSVNLIFCVFCPRLQGFVSGWWEFRRISTYLHMGRIYRFVQFMCGSVDISVHQFSSLISLSFFYFCVMLNI